MNEIGKMISNRQNHLKTKKTWINPQKKQITKLERTTSSTTAINERPQEVKWQENNKNSPCFCLTLWSVHF